MQVSEAEVTKVVFLVRNDRKSNNGIDLFKKKSVYCSVLN